MLSVGKYEIKMGPRQAKRVPKVIARRPEYHDPADELIVATSRLHKLTLVTTDTKPKTTVHAHIHYFTPIKETKDLTMPDPELGEP